MTATAKVLIGKHLFNVGELLTMNKLRAGAKVGVIAALLTAAVGYSAKPVFADMTPTSAVDLSAYAGYVNDTITGSNGNIYVPVNDGLLQITPAGVVTDFNSQGGGQKYVSVDSVTGNVWAADRNGSVFEYDSAGNGLGNTYLRDSQGNAYGATDQIIYGPLNHLWVFTPGAILEYNPADLSVPLNSYAAPVSTNDNIILGGDGNFWIGDYNNVPTISKVTLTGSVTTYSFNVSTYTQNTSAPKLAPAADGIWTNLENVSVQAQLTKVAYDGTMTQYPNAFNGQNYGGSSAIVVDKSGNVWSSVGSGAIVEDSSTGVFVDKAAPSYSPNGLAAASDGKVYYTDSNTNFLYSLPGSAGGSSCTGNASQNVACATVAVGAGSLIRLNAPDVNYAAINLNGAAQVTNANVAYQVRDATGSGSGWNMTLSATTFTDLSNIAHTLPNDALTLNVPTGQVCLLPGCTPATSSVTSPVSIATGSGNSYKIVNATANTGMGSVETDTSTSLAIPASAYQGSYQSTWTLSLTSGP